MASLQGTFVLIERNPGDVAGTAPSFAYLMDHPSISGRYVLGDSRVDATAFLALAAGVYHLDNDSAAQDRALYLVSPTRIVA